MFYKNTEHYENTFKMCVRESLGVEIQFNSDKVKDLMYMFWLTSDRNNKDRKTAGYDLLCWVKYRCENYDDFYNAFTQLIEEIDYSEMDDVDTFQLSADFLFYNLGITPQREEF